MVKSRDHPGHDYHSADVTCPLIQGVDLDLLGNGESDRRLQMVGEDARRWEVCRDHDRDRGTGVVDGLKVRALSRDDHGLGRRQRDGARAEEIQGVVKASLLGQYEPVLCGHYVLRRLSWQHVEVDVESLAVPSWRRPI